MPLRLNQVLTYPVKRFLSGCDANIVIMNRANGRCRLRILLYGGILPLATSHDVVEDSATSRTMLEEECSRSGMDRLRQMFSLNEYGALRPELHMCLQSALTGLMFGAAYGGFIWSRRAYTEFIERNQATVFTNHMDAKKALQDYITINFAKGAFMWGWRLAMFGGSFMLVSTSVSVYRGKVGILEYVLAGGFCGSVFRTHLGIRGMLVGGLLGLALGTCAGCSIYSLLKVSGITMEEIQAAQYRWKQLRMDIKNQRRTEFFDKDDPVLYKERDNLKETVSSLEILESNAEK